MQLQLDVRAGRMLAADWFRRLAQEAGLALNNHGNRGDSFTLGRSNAFNVTAKFQDQPPYLKFTASDVAQQGLIDSLASQAFARVASGDLGDVVWYSTSMSVTGFEAVAPFSMGPFFERLGVQTRIVGWRRLGRDVLIEFAEELPPHWNESNPLFAPKTLIHVHIAASAPCHGFFSSYVAHAVLEVVAAICTFALGRGVPLPPSIFASRSEKVAEFAPKRLDPSVLTLARKHVPLDIFSIVAPGGFDHFSRMRAAFLTFDAALQQQRDSVACILYVVAAESLSVPNAAWRDAKATKRFIDFFRELMPGNLDKMVSHGNFETVFGICRGKRSSGALRRELLNRIYVYRSGHVHMGLRPNYTGVFGAGLGPWNDVRRSLFADFAEAAILSYLQSPRSSLIGHPSFDTSKNE